MIWSSCWGVTELLKILTKKFTLQITSRSFIIFIKFLVRGHCSEPFYRVRVNQRDHFPLNVGRFPLSATPPPACWLYPQTHKGGGGGKRGIAEIWYVHLPGPLFTMVISSQSMAMPSFWVIKLYYFVNYCRIAVNCNNKKFYNLALWWQT